jgi:hypothetical protein
VPVREGLGRLDGVAFISKYPDLKAATCELRLAGGRFIDPFTLSNHIFDIRVGARLRGLEAEIDGTVEPPKAGTTNVVFKVSGTNTVLHLAPLTRKVQKDVAAKQPQPATAKESTAFRDLISKMKAKSRPVRVIGPLLRQPDGSMVLEVRSFKFN